MSENSKAKKDDPDASKAGLSKHYKDFIKLVEDEESRKVLIDSANQILKNKRELGILNDIPQTVIQDVRILFVLAHLAPSSMNAGKIKKVKAIIDEESMVIESDYKNAKHRITDDCTPYLIIPRENEYVIDIRKAESLNKYDFDKVFDNIRADD